MGYISLEEEITLWPFRYFDNSYNYLNYHFKAKQNPLHFFRVDIPVDSLASDYIQSKKQRKHNNYLKIRKTAKRGKKKSLCLAIYLFTSLLVFLIWCLGGGFLQHFVEAILLNILLKPEYDPPVKSLEDFMDRDMTLRNVQY